MKGKLIAKTWERCKSIGRSPKKATASAATGEGLRRDVRAPEGCFPVYVGQRRQRFVIRAEYANHPLFKVLLEEAEMEFGFTSDGPLVLPCDVSLFQRVLVAMDDLSDSDDDEITQRLGCSSRGVSRGCSPYRRLSLSGMVAVNQF